MLNTRYEIRDTRYKAGFTVVELLIALAITGILLAAIAAAFNASIINYRQNEDIFKTINSARQALVRMTNQLRTAKAVDPNAPNNECSFFTTNTTNGRDITYRFNNADNKLYLITNDDLFDTDYVLCNNVTAMTFMKTKEFDVELDRWYVESVQISMTVVSGDVEKTLSAATVIRRNLK